MSCRALPPVALAATLCVAPAFGQLVIDEIDYDQPGSDTAEWIEIRLAWDDLYFLDDVDLVLYDANLSGTCTEYCRVDLSPLVVMSPGQIVIIGAHPNAVLPLCTSTDAIQNGGPDAIAIEQGGTILHSVEYESGLTQSVCSLPMTSGADSDVLSGSLQRCPASGLWEFVTTSSPGSLNSCQ